jgi:tRNA N6-adenosine threonylcarbamoyltransferase
MPRWPDGLTMLVLGIETTCDETAAAVVERHDDGRATILSNVVLSQIAEHAAFGGVVPEIAARAHVEALDLIIATAMADAGRDFAALDGVAAAAGPGLIGGVIVGLITAKAIALVHQKPLIAVNHLEAHALTARLTDGTSFPYCVFLASGGHTQIVAVRDVGDYVRLGTTRDDAIGEAFDKTAKLLGLGYPGGRRVEQEAVRGDASRIILPRPMLGRPDADFSLSGLKTALRLEAEKIAPLTNQDVADLCASFQLAVIETAVDRLRQGLRMFRRRLGDPSALVAAGGVAANQAIRAALRKLASQEQVALVVPPPSLCTDNAAMIAWAGAERLAHGLRDELDTSPRARWPLDQVGGSAIAPDVAPPTPSPPVGEGRREGSRSCGTEVPSGSLPIPAPSSAEPRSSEGSASQQSDRSRQPPTSVGAGEQVVA